ncbi:MAG TPA: maleylpyruvate isomerase family mycothiol-dependent enzyme [Actinomycetota bacterium]|nr:maleylpyruvate isomerase family mycothiol-dependent enzyme [Actinomycetota bacterium]
MNDVELSERLAAVRGAEERLLRTLDALDDHALRRPSLLPRWTRGHVLAHVALNAHSLVNLFTWARTGVETPQYPSWEERDGAIERHSGRTAAEHRAALIEASTAFTGAARAVPAERWDHEVSGIGGSPQPARTFLFGRLREVEIHHVDLHAGYGPRDWSGDFVRAVLGEVPGRLTAGAGEPFVAVATDLGMRLEIGGNAAAREVSGPGAELLAWLLGRSAGDGLSASGGALPAVPPWG